MDAQELMVGNYIGLNLKEFTENFFTVFEVAESTMVLYDGIHKPGPRASKEYYDAELLEGIPLNYDWLQQLGFKRKNDLRVWLHPETMNFELFQKQEGAFWYAGRFIKDELYWLVISPRLMYVHQLQNLYFALTYKKLTIK